MSDTMHTSDLRGRAAPSEIRFGSGGKIVALVAVLAAAAALAGYGYETGQFRIAPQPVVSNSELPTTSAPNAQGQ